MNARSQCRVAGSREKKEGEEEEKEGGGTERKQEDEEEEEEEEEAWAHVAASCTYVYTQSERSYEMVVVADVKSYSNQK